MPPEELHHLHLAPHSPILLRTAAEKVKAVQSMLTKAHNLRSDDGSPLPTRPKSTIKTQVNEAISAERERINNIKSSIDTDIRDEEAGKLRVQLAAESKARRAAEKKELEERQRLLLSNLQQAEETKTDDDISDEAAGRARLALAEKTQAHRAKEWKRLQEKSRREKQRVRNSLARNKATLNTSPEPVYVDRKEVARALKEAEQARLQAALARDSVLRDQQEFRKQMAARSRKTPSPTKSPPSPAKEEKTPPKQYTPTIGIFNAGLYRLSNVAGQARINLEGTLGYSRPDDPVYDANDPFGEVVAAHSA